MYLAINWRSENTSRMPGVLKASRHSTESSAVLAESERVDGVAGCRRLTKYEHIEMPERIGATY